MGGVREAEEEGLGSQRNGKIMQHSTVFCNRKSAKRQKATKIGQELELREARGLYPLPPLPPPPPPYCRVACKEVQEELDFFSGEWAGYCRKVKLASNHSSLLALGSECRAQYFVNKNVVFHNDYHIINLNCA